jgi:tetrapyrrole methylase family protein / MazG family protein
MSNEMTTEFEALVATIAKLRSKDGCPWDRQQTHDSLKNYAIEETYEVVEAIDGGNPHKLEEELGDLMLQVLLHAQIASEAGEFDITGVCRTIKEKLQRRHPHVFGDTEVANVDEVLHNWEQIKRAEPGYEDRESVLDGIPAGMPALMRATKISNKAARTGFEWPDVQAVFGKLAEESDELKEAVDQGSQQRIKEEIGDLLFTVVNIARWADIDAEEALREMLMRFTYRFNRIEDHARDTGRDIHQLTLEEMDQVWEQSK